MTVSTIGIPGYAEYKRQLAQLRINGLTDEAIATLKWIVTEYSKRVAYAKAHVAFKDCQEVAERNVFVIPTSHRGRLNEAHKTFERFFGKTYDVAPTSLVADSWLQGTHEDNMKLVESVVPNYDQHATHDQFSEDMTSAWDDMYVAEADSWVVA